MLYAKAGAAGQDIRGSVRIMGNVAAETLFQLAIAMRAAYPHRSSYDRGSPLTVDLAVAYGERLLRAARRDAHTVTTGPVWQPGRES
jgi:hypothetical protein